MLLAALPNATAAESILQSFVALVMHRPTADSFFRKYAEVDGARKRKLKPAQVRQVLEAIGMEGEKLLDEAAFAAVVLLDRNSDGGISQGEWAAALQVLQCFLPRAGDPIPAEADADALAALRRLGGHFGALSRGLTVGGLFGLMEELHTCPALVEWWDGKGQSGGWIDRLANVERKMPMAPLLKLDKWVCAARLPDRLLSHTDIKLKPHLADLLAVRTAFKLDLGMTSLLLRQFFSVRCRARSSPFALGCQLARCPPDPLLPRRQVHLPRRHRW